MSRAKKAPAQRKAPKKPAGEKNKGGRPSKYTEALGRTICERVAFRALHAVCQDPDMPSRESVYAWLHKYPAFLDGYTRARKTRAFARAERLDDVLDNLRSGVIDAATARVEMDAIKWQTGKENAPVFGDRVALAGDAETPIRTESTVTVEPGEAYMRLLNPNA